MKNIYTFQKINKYSICLHLVTQKEPTAPYSFSLALHTKEEPNQILKNRDSLKQKFPNMNFVVANQTHSSNIHIVTKEQEIGWQKAEDAIENCDALISNIPNVMLTILTADCVPILLLDPKQKVVSAIHAGWKGTEQEIVFKTVKKMKEEFNSNPNDIIAGVAPSIGKCCYEVDWNVAQHFENIDNAYKKVGNKYMLDLPYINKTQLLKAGLKEENIELSHVCTSCEVEHYFSYRKEKGCSGRFMSMIGLI